MENTQPASDQQHHQSNNQPISPVVPAPDGYRQQWRNHRKCRMAIGAIVAIVIAIIIFLAGIVVGRATSHFHGYRSMSSGYYGQMQMRGGMGAMGGASSGMRTMHGTTASPTGTGAASTAPKNGATAVPAPSSATLTPATPANQ